MIYEFDEKYSGEDYKKFVDLFCVAQCKKLSQNRLLSILRRKYDKINLKRILSDLIQFLDPNKPIEYRIYIIGFASIFQHLSVFIDREMLEKNLSAYENLLITCQKDLEIVYQQNIKPLRLGNNPHPQPVFVFVEKNLFDLVWYQKNVYIFLTEYVSLNTTTERIYEKMIYFNENNMLLRKAYGDLDLYEKKSACQIIKLVEFYIPIYGEETIFNAFNYIFSQDIDRKKRHKLEKIYFLIKPLLKNFRKDLSNTISDKTNLPDALGGLIEEFM